MRNSYFLIAGAIILYLQMGTIVQAKNSQPLSVTQKVVSLTFDDGPSPKTTGMILDILKKEQVKATFFVLGQHAKDYPELIRRIHDEGHEIGNHTYDHKNLRGMSIGGIRQEIKKTQDILEGAQLTVNWFRPPYGAGRAKASPVASEFNLKTVLWTVDTRDWQKSSAQSVEQSVDQNVKDGSIVLMHDTKAVTVKALESIINQLKRNKYSFLTLSEREMHDAGKHTEELRVAMTKEDIDKKSERSTG
ncbi:MAG: polysaccharide deacetylase family protein [Alphaproteobacteria bacterium]|nr:polysaccharide deacetylase family protein [Alphaproteobacteria bacterium]